MRYLSISLMAVWLATLTACAAPTTAPATLPPAAVSVATSTPTDIAPSEVPATDTAVPATAAPATSLPAPSSTPLPTQAPTASPASTAAGPIRLSFALGATDLDINGPLAAGETRTYLLAAVKNQPLIVGLSSPDNAAHLTLTGQDGTQLLPANPARTTWQGLLPKTQDYVLQVSAPPAASFFDLNVEAAARLTFAPGAISTTVTGTAQAGPVVTYVLRALAGQTLTATLKSAGDAVVLTLYGFQDGQPLIRSAAGATTFTSKLPATQDYIVKAVQSANPVDYTLTLTVK